jgi:large subunit ribosomal protein L18
MKRNESKIIRRGRRKAGIRKQLMGQPGRPRLTIFRSARHIYAQLIDDLSGRTLASASTAEKAGGSSGAASSGSNCEAAKAVGTQLGERAKAAGISAAAFDRNGYKYHGRVKALADAAREAGLKF